MVIGCPMLRRCVAGRGVWTVLSRQFHSFGSPRNTLAKIIQFCLPLFPRHNAFSSEGGHQGRFYRTEVSPISDDKGKEEL
jgi:hypothetical protein